MSFHHTEPTLFRVQVQGKYYVPHSTATWFFGHLMINDYVLYVDKFVPNNAKRHQNAAHTEIGMSDHIGGVHLFTHSSGTITYTFSNIIYLSSGLHTFTVGVRAGINSNLPVHVFYGVLTIETLEPGRHADIGIPLMDVDT